MIGYTIKFSHFEYGTLIWENDDHPILYLLEWGIMWVKQCHFYHPWLGMVNIPAIKNDDDWGMVYEILLPTLVDEATFWWLFFSCLGKNCSLTEQKNDVGSEDHVFCLLSGHEIERFSIVLGKPHSMFLSFFPDCDATVLSKSVSHMFVIRHLRVLSDSFIHCVELFLMSSKTLVV